MTFKKLNNIVGWSVFAIATIVYFLTMEPTVSWWDCGEYISTAYKLQVGHPPGAPTFQLLGRFFSLFAFGDVTKVAMMINIMSCLCSSFTILFLYWTISMLAQKIWMKDGDDSPRSNQWSVIAAAAIGALAFTFTDSFWFNAVEGEVYAMSSLLTAITFWAILKWERVANEPNHYRWLIFIAYLIGLSIGVHLLNLLAIPAITYIVYFKKYTFNWKGFIIAGIVSVAVLAFVYVLLIPAVVSLAGKFEIFFVNTIGFPFNFGTIFYFALIIALIVWGLWYTTKLNRPVLNTIILSFMFILIGYSSFFMLVIRANANTPINENEPKDAISMLSYLKREQYGSWPLLYGPYYNAKPVGREDSGSPIYRKDYKQGKYLKVAEGYRDLKYKDEDQTIFPRMWSTEGKCAPIYERYWDKTAAKRPTFGQNFKFFIDYQCNWMYWRYFMWNFVGRQNDIESQGELQDGNWISGISFIDNARLGDQSNLPRTMQSTSQTKYYFLPLILGLIGLFYQIKKDYKNCWVVFLLFFMTGLAIIIDLNQIPRQPRERDYSYAGSFYAFAIWMGFGVLGLIDGLKKLIKNHKVAIPVAAGLCLCVPILMAAQGWEGHDRSGKTAARDWGKNYLTQLPPNAVIFTRGDNDTFPLWYAQEVEGYRTDVRVCNFMLASSHWYVHQMARKVYESDRLPLTLPPEKYDEGVNESIKIKGSVAQYELKEAIEYVKSSEPSRKIKDDKGHLLDQLPTHYLKLTITEEDKDKMIANGIVPADLRDQIVDKIEFTLPYEGLIRHHLMFLDFLATNNWERAIYFTDLSEVFENDSRSSDPPYIDGLAEYMYSEGLAYRFMPLRPEYFELVDGQYLDGSYDLLVNKARWGNLNDPAVTVDRESVRNVTFVKRRYLLLAEAYVGVMDNAKAIEVLDKCQELFPDEKIPYGDSYEIYIPELYYSAGANDKGDEMLMTIVDNTVEELEYFRNLKPKFIPNYKDDIRRDLSILKTMLKAADKRPDIKNDLVVLLSDYLNSLADYIQ